MKSFNLTDGGFWYGSYLDFCNLTFKPGGVNWVKDMAEFYGTRARVKDVFSLFATYMIDCTVECRMFRKNKEPRLWVCIKTPHSANHGYIDLIFLGAGDAHVAFDTASNLTQVQLEDMSMSKIVDIVDWDMLSHTRDFINEQVLTRRVGHGTVAS